MIGRVVCSLVASTVLATTAAIEVMVANLQSDAQTGGW